jgi:hypothetical protein
MRTTAEVAESIGMTRQGLINYLVRHPELRPARKVFDRNYLWTDEEIERLVESRSKRRPIRK